MAELHEALKHLGPAVWSEFPTSEQELETYIGDLFSKAQLIVDSVPVPSPEDAAQQSHAHPAHRARNASEVTLSSERSPAPPPDHAKLQKEWGKPMKIKASENPLGLSVYKMSGKEGRGAWFARHSIHEGIGFERFKKSLVMEFEKSLAEPGPPGTGNVRGIGGEERVEQIKTDKACIEVYRLSAQFPGPTAPRDFVTLLITSEKALAADSSTAKSAAPAVTPQHYIIISKPCDHPKTQPKQGMVRGFYESIEFIREVPRKLKTAESDVDLEGGSSKHLHHKHGQHHQPQHPGGADNALEHGANTKQEQHDTDDNPVEWLMITRSDPGGGIPRFLVERGTPGSICGDAVKFVDWACSNDEMDIPQTQTEEDPRLLQASRRESYQSWRGRSVVGIAETEGAEQPVQGSSQADDSAAVSETASAPTAHQNQGLLGTMSEAAASLRPYTPQVILNHLPGSHAESVTADGLHPNDKSDAHEDSKSIMSTTSFASAEENWSSSSLENDGEVTSLESFPPQSPTQSREYLHHEKVTQKIKDRRQALHDKFAATKAKHEEARARQLEKDADISGKAVEKHERELRRHEEKFQKELQKLEKRQDKERKKMVDKQRKETDKDEKAKLARERDEARQETELLRKEVESLRKMIQDLQKENTSLVMKYGRSTVSLNESGSGTRSRGSSINRRDKEKIKVADGTNPDLAVAGAAASLRAKESPKT